MPAKGCTMAFRLCHLLCALGLIAPAILLAQGNYATVTGIVVDSGQAVMPGVQISIRNVDTNISRTVQTSPSGDFTVTNLNPGTYALKAEMTGFRTHEQTGIVLEIGQTLRSDIKLELGSVNESISVTAQPAA